MIDPVAARAKILEAILSNLGNMTRAAEELGTNYFTLNRAIMSDQILLEQVRELKHKLMGEGHHQRGWGDWHQGRIEK